MTTTPILENALRMARRAEIDPKTIKRKIIKVGTILATNVIVATVSAAMIVLGVFETEPAQLVAAFLLLGSLAVILASFGAILVILWSAYVYEYIEATEARSETKEVLGQTEDILTGLASIKEDYAFSMEITRVAMSELVSSSETKLLLQKGLSATVARKLYDLISKRIVRRQDTQVLLEDVAERRN